MRTEYFQISVLFILFIGLYNCKSKADTNFNRDSNLQNIIIKNSFDDASNCLVQSDSLEVRRFVKELINEIDNGNVDELSSKFVYPMAMFSFKFESQKDFIVQWNKDDRLKNYLSLDIYDENDKYLKKSNISNTHVIFYKSESKKDCINVQFGLGSGLIFNIDRIDEEIKIIKFDTVG